MELTEDQLNALNIITLGIQANRIRKQIDSIMALKNDELMSLSTQNTQERNDFLANDESMRVEYIAQKDAEKEAFIASKETDLSAGANTIVTKYQEQLDNLTSQLNTIVKQSEILQNA